MHTCFQCPEMSWSHSGTERHPANLKERPLLWGPCPSLLNTFISYLIKVSVSTVITFCQGCQLVSFTSRGYTLKKLSPSHLLRDGQVKLKLLHRRSRFVGKPKGLRKHQTRDGDKPATAEKTREHSAWVAALLLLSCGQRSSACGHEAAGATLGRDYRLVGIRKKHEIKKGSDEKTHSIKKNQCSYDTSLLHDNFSEFPSLSSWALPQASFLDFIR